MIRIIPHTSQIINKNTLLLVLVFCANFLLAQIQLIAQADKTELSVNERFVLDFYLQINGNEQYDINEFLQLPDLDNFHTLAVRDSRSTQYNNGALVSRVGQQIILVATKQGTFTIGKATIKINGKTLETKPLKITVKKSKEIQQPTQGKRIKGAFLMAQVSNQTPYVNEGTVLTVKLYARDYSILNRKTNFKLPKFNDFIVQKLSPDQLQNNFKQEVVNNDVFISEEIAKYILFPKQAGKLDIEPFSIDVILSNFYGSERIELTTPNIQLASQDLPKDNQPNNFSGAVGDFTIKTDVSKTNLNSNESLNLDIELIGAGNLNMIEIPDIVIPKEIEVYQPKKRNKFDTKPTGVKGKLVNEYVLVPQYGGNYTIDPIEFTYFDPQDKSYKSISSQAIKINVKGSPPPTNNQIARQEEGQTDSASQDQASNDNQIQINNQPTTAKHKQPKEKSANFLNSQWFWVVSGGIALVLISLILFLAKPKNKGTQQNQQPTKKEKQAELNQAIKQLATTSDAVDFHKKQEQILTNLGMYITQLPLADFTPNLAAEKLAVVFDAEVANRYKNSLLKAKEIQYSAHANAVDLDNKLAETKNIIKQILG